mmetsp:Transcript_13024/g.34669  ORF Transcript_13024/g.34669 Transcript_13024/m.34669 type:complete len:119 (-) Transcript_13024:45-401(-)
MAAASGDARGLRQLRRERGSALCLGRASSSRPQSNVHIVSRDPRAEKSASAGTRTSRDTSIWGRRRGQHGSGGLLPSRLRHLLRANLLDGPSVADISPRMSITRRGKRRIPITVYTTK